jgi:hypothetical protein
MPVNGGSMSLAHHKQAKKAAQKRLEELYRSLGARTYACMKEQQFELPELEIIKTEIDNTILQLDMNTEEIERFKAMKQAPKGASCPQCGMKSLPGIVVCPRCGRQLQAGSEPAVKKKDMIVCLHCGGEITADSIFCGMCGGEVVEQVKEVEQVTPLEPVQDQVVKEPTAAEMSQAAAPESEAEIQYQTPIAELQTQEQPEKRLSDTSLRDTPQTSPQLTPQLPGKELLPSPSLPSLQPLVEEQIASPQPIAREPWVVEPKTTSTPQAETPMQVQPVPLVGAVPNLHAFSGPAAEGESYSEPSPPAEKRCSKCGEVQRPEAAFCFSCGERL